MEPIYDDDDSFSNYGFSELDLSGTKLGASGYSIGTILIDNSPSIMDFKDELERCLKDCVRACRKSTRADNLILRVVLFDRFVYEVHQAKYLKDINLDEYTGILQPRGKTALRDGFVDCLKVKQNLARDLDLNHDKDVNGALYVITDGWDNCSKVSLAETVQAYKETFMSESLETLTTVLIQVNDQNPIIRKRLEEFRTALGIKYKRLEDTDPDSLAKLANFISQSLSSVAQSVGTGQTPVTPDDPTDFSI